MAGTGTIKQNQLELTDTYQQYKAHWDDRLHKLRKKAITLGWIRLLLFAGAFALPFLLFKAWSTPFFLTFGFLFIAFLVIVKVALKVGREIQHATFMSEINETEMRALKGDWHFIPDGKELMIIPHDYANDLDLFGTGSLFQFINRTSTYGGFRELGKKLNHFLRSPEAIRLRQESIRELAANLDFRQQFYTHGKLTKEDEKTHRLIGNITQIDFSFLAKKTTGFLLKSFPVLFILLTVLTLTKTIPSNVLVYFFLAGITISGKYLKRINQTHSQISSLGKFINNYSSLIALIEAQKFNSAELNQLQAKLSANQKSASHSINELGKLLHMFDQRLNILVGIILNGCFLWDLNVVKKVEKWMTDKGSNLAQWMDVIYQFDALNSLAGFAYNHPDYCWPELSNKTILDTEKLGHPLIPFQDRVDNNFNFSKAQRIAIVTGANMAGKSTFLRTIGVNLVLAGNGTVVCASNFVYKPLRLITNMRAIDSLMKSESYFFSELKRLKSIVDTLQEEKELFFILDEILKGTNSHDKTMGSIALTEQLLLKGGTGLIATHDLELGGLTDTYPEQICNQCFEVIFDDAQLRFDYLLRKGITQSHNATYLMRKMGLIPEQKS
ncbi:hypothetical protein DMA11_06650 [Marinilabiliaceae bacterium JC017]|nr:hypothetical protein DMA11_06650 [Marinilabiliaceae bacterium JC017]